jgi:hypothetical protein
MKKLLLAVVAAMAFQGCAGGGGVYPDTDVVEPRDSELKVATGIQKSGGLLQATGTLRKDNRTCALEFTSASGQVKITIKLSPTK